MSKKKVLLSYHGKEETKAEYIDRIKSHMAADEIQQNYGYWSDGKGCAVGCTIHSSEHSSYEDELGIPRGIAVLEDTLFEQMGKEDARKWPLAFLEAVPVGVDLSEVERKLLYKLLTHRTLGAPAVKDEKVQAFYDKLLMCLLKGGKKEELSELEDEAYNFKSKGMGQYDQSYWAYDFMADMCGALANDELDSDYLYGLEMTWKHRNLKNTGNKFNRLVAEILLETLKETA